KLISLFSAPYIRIPITASNFAAQFPPQSSDDVNLYKDLIFPRAPKPNRHSRDLLHVVQSYYMAAVDFLHQENPPTWNRSEPATLGVQKASDQSASLL
ncbi:hypothetical protein TNCV_18461, partial [Trichonephila clavipes]